MEDIKKTILDTLNERIASPLIGGYIISWILWNSKTVLILLSTKSVEEKYYFINYNIYHDNFHFFLSGMLAPLFFALFFIFIFPYPEKFVYRFWHTRKKELMDEKQKIDDQKLLSVGDSRKLKRRYLELELEFNESLEKKNNEIRNLKSIIAENEKNKLIEDGTNILSDLKAADGIDIEVNNEMELPKINIEKPRTESRISDISNGVIHTEDYRSIEQIRQSELQDKESEFKILFNINDKEMLILKTLYDNGKEELSKFEIQNLISEHLNWNMLKTKKIIEKFLKNKYVIEENMHTLNYILTPECIDKLVELYD